jgi:sigma-B regulation protein RsbU (phosphoserine phosphatase)
MSPATAPRILVAAGRMESLAELRHLLTGGGFDVAGHLFDMPLPDGLSDRHLFIVESDGAAQPALDLCRRIRVRLADRFVPLLVITADQGGETRLGCLDAGADASLLRPLAPGELLAQVRALLRIKESHDRLQERTTEVNRINRSLQEAYQRFDQELELAQRLQSSFLPQALPQVPHVRFGVHYLLCGRVGGDFYDVFRLDEHHVGFYVADAMGHGVPASLLTIYVKKGVYPKEVFGCDYRLVPPGEVLNRLNRDLIEQHLSETPFITMAYGLLNHHDGTLRLARAGHPYPLYVPRDGQPELWRQEGFLLGINPATYAERSYPLRPGDKVLIYTDGVDNARFEEHAAGSDSLLACAARHRELPIRPFVDHLARDLFGADALPDDLTLFGIEMGGD